MDKILILGINGFIGRNFQSFIIKNVLQEKFLFTGVDKNIKKLIPINYRKVNLLHYNNFQKLILSESPDYIINLTGIFNSDNITLMEDINVAISKNLFEIILKKGIKIKNILLIGSAAEYGMNDNLPLNENAKLSPVNLNGLTKAIQTLYSDFYFNNFGVSVNIARTFNLIGKNLSPLLSVGSFASQIRNAKNNGTIYVGNLNTKRDFLNVKDAVSAYWKILLSVEQGQIYNVCSGRSYYIKDILDFLIKRSGKKLKISVKKELLKPNDILDSFGDNSKLKKDTGWKEENDIFTALAEMLEN